MRNLATLPKGDLHLHLEAGMRPSTLADLAARYDMVMATIRDYGDDPLLFGPGILDEYELCRQELGLDDAQLAFIARWLAPET